MSEHGDNGDGCSTCPGTTIMAAGVAQCENASGVATGHLASGKYTPAMFRHEKIQKPFGQFNYVLPEIQRTAVSAAIDAIYAAETAHFNRYATYCLPGSISVAVDETSGMQYLIDGQHRMAAYARLLAEFPERPITVLADYYYYSTADGLDVLYKQVNTCQVNPIAELSIDHYKVLRETEQYFMRTFPRYFRASTRPRRPNLNMSTLLEKLRESHIVQRLGIRQGQQLVVAMLDINRFYATQPVANFAAWKIPDAVNLCAKIEAESNRLYLGMYTNYEWIRRIIHRHESGEPYAAVVHTCNTYRVRVLAHTRKAVWQRYNATAMAGECYCCRAAIDFANFECGHVVAVASGGQPDADNLRPVCRTCNRDMGTMNLEEYRAMIQ